VSGYEFTLVLDREPTEAEEESIALRAPAILGVEGGNVALAHVDLEADRFTDALVTAVRQIEALGLSVVGLRTNDLVSLKEIAQRTGRSYESVRLLAASRRGPGGFPAPISHEPWGLYSWTAVAMWFTDNYSGQHFEFDRQAVAADHLLRARHMVGASHGAEWARLLTA
jgi:hypothetical protein